MNPENSPKIPTPADPTRPAGLLLSRDLFFTSKITGTARELGGQVLTAGNVSLAASMIETWHPRVVFIDLSAGDLTAPEALIALKEVAGDATPFIAFGPHVEAARLDQAAEAGCDIVLPRSKFTAELPALIRRHLLHDGYTQQTGPLE